MFVVKSDELFVQRHEFDDHVLLLGSKTRFGELLGRSREAKHGEITSEDKNDSHRSGHK